MTDNEKFIFKSLEALEAHGKFKEIHWLTGVYFCEEVLKIPLKVTDEIGIAYPVLIRIYKGMDKKYVMRDHNYQSRYYAPTFMLNGVEFLVINYWKPKNRDAFLTWLKSVLGSDFPELAEIEAALKSNSTN